MTTELAKAKEVARCRRQIRQLIEEARLAGLVDGIQKFAWIDDQNGYSMVGPEFDSTDLNSAIEDAVEEVREDRKKLLADPDKGPNVAELARILLASIGVYSCENGVAIAALEIVKNEILQAAREAATIASITDSMRRAFAVESETEH